MSARFHNRESANRLHLVSIRRIAGSDKNAGHFRYSRKNCLAEYAIALRVAASVKAKGRLGQGGETMTAGTAT